MNAIIEAALNAQISMEARASQIYLSMASWAENNGLNGTAQFMYTHSDEERVHMLKLIKFVNERGGKAIIPAIEKPPIDIKDLEDVFTRLLNHEIEVTESINNIVGLCLDQRDYSTHNFIQWYVAEQREEEALAKTIVDKIKLIGSDKGGLYLLDKDLENSSISRNANNTTT